ncbi:MAG: OmpA family protein [bacterium]|nr:OmpA family protein [bacterium]
MAVLLLAILAAGTAQAQTPPGTHLLNTAEAAYDAGGRTGIIARSNTVALTVQVTRTQADLGYLRVVPPSTATGILLVPAGEYSTSGTVHGPWAPLPADGGTSVPFHDFTSPVTTAPEDVFHQNEPILLHLADPDQDLDHDTAETVLVSVTVAATGDHEVLRLTETDLHSGVFAGLVQAEGGDQGVPGDGLLTARADAEARGRYQDTAYPDDTAEAIARFDPLCRVFDSATGRLLDGARLSLVDALTGEPAVVLADDGTSLFPAAVVSGSTVTDAGGGVLDFTSGGFRFPWITPGRYQLRIDPPPGYLAPSRTSLADLQSLPGGPWNLDDLASRGGDFDVFEGPPLVLDIPLDAAAAGDLYLSKRAGKQVVAPGEFVPWELQLANNGVDEALQLTIEDRLPRGFRLVPGSVTVDGTPAPDPEISADGRTLVFSWPALASGGTLTIRYVTAVDVAAAQGEAVSTANAVHAAMRSNTARAGIIVEDELFFDRALLVGRVTASDCNAPADSTVGVPGVRIYLEDGASVVTDEQGRYHFEDVTPGAHVVQLDTETLPARYEAGACGADDHRADHPFARFVDVMGGSLWRTDFQLRLKPRAAGRAAAELDVTLTGDLLDSRVKLDGAGVPLRNVRLTVMLPDRATFVPGTATRDGVALDDPKNRHGVLVWRLGHVPADWHSTVSFTARIDSTTRRAELETAALLVVDTPTTTGVRTEPARATVHLVPEQVRLPLEEVVLRPRFRSLEAVLSPVDRADLDSLAAHLEDLEIVSLRIVGHSDSQGISPASRHLFADNYALGLARAQAVADHLALRLHMPADRLAVYSRGPEAPVAGNATPEGRALNRRVVVEAWAERIIHRVPSGTQRDHARQEIVLAGLRPGEDWNDDAVVDDEESATMPVFDMAWLETATAGFEMLWPPVDLLPAMPTVKIAVKHDPNWWLSLRINGLRVDKVNFDGTAHDAANTKAVTRWTGVDLREGDNLCEVVARDGGGAEMGRLSRSIHFSGPPVHMELLPEASDLTASGRRPAEIAIRLTDRDGFPVRRGMVGEFGVDAPYEPERVRSEDRKQALGSLEDPRPTYTVGRNGVARVRLEPTTRSGEVVLRVPLLERREEVRAWLEPEARDWILVGLADGTVGWNAVSGNLENLATDDRHEEFYGDGRLAFFARGRVKGRWLLTAAYDSRRDVDDRRSARLFGAVDPDAFYTVYGDASVQTHDAASRAPLYVKLEREKFYALFGDYATGLTITELGRYNRRLTGLKSSIRHGRFDATAFAARAHETYGREEIPGDGTSGIYRLATGNLVVNSEQVTVQVRDRYRSEIVVSEQRLTRFLDYDIDFAAGTLVFREPVFGTDQDFNPRFIVVEYETWDDRDPQWQAGGRAAAHACKQAELGITVLHEGGHGTGGDLAAADLRLDVTESLRLEGEIAGSDTDLEGRHGAFLAELQQRSEMLDAKAWVRRQESGFGLGQQRFGEAGMFKYGADADWRLTRAWKLGGRAYREENLATDAARDLYETRLAWNDGPWASHLGHRQAVDHLAGGDERRSFQLRAGASVGLLRNRLRLRADHEHALHDANENPDFPTKTAAGVEYQFIPQVTTFLDAEATHGSLQDRTNVRTGVRSTPWSGGEATTSLEQEYNEAGTRVYRNAGLKQTLHLNERWSLDGGVDHARVTGDAGGQVNPAISPTAGPREGYTAVALGATCRGPNWRWTQRGEYRDSDTEDKWHLDGSLFVEPTSSLGLQAGARLNRVDGPGTRRAESEVRVGLAWRPPASAWTVLQRLSYKTEDQLGGTFELANWRIVNNVNTTWQAHSWLQIALRHGARYARETVDGRDYRGYTDLFGLEARYFFSRRWDVGLQTSARNSWSSHVHDLSLGAAVGLKVLEDVWLSLGYNVAGFRDRDFTGGYTAQGPFLRFRFRFNQESKHEMLR